MRCSTPRSSCRPAGGPDGQFRGRPHESSAPAGSSCRTCRGSTRRSPTARSPATAGASGLHRRDEGERRHRPSDGPAVARRRALAPATISRRWRAMLARRRACRSRSTPSSTAATRRPRAPSSYLASSRRDCRPPGVRIATVGGRYYAHGPRQALGPGRAAPSAALVDAEGERARRRAARRSRRPMPRGETDEFVKPTVDRRLCAA